MSRLPKFRFSLLLAIIFVLTVAADCNDRSDVTRVAVPASDSTPPTIAFDVILPGGEILSPTSGRIDREVGCNDAVTLSAQATDTDGGVRTVQISMGIGSWVDNPDGTKTQRGPGNSSVIQESAIMAAIGELVPISRNTATNYDMEQHRGNVILEISARGFNFHNGQANSNFVVLTAENCP